MRATGNTGYFDAQQLSSGNDAFAGSAGGRLPSCLALVSVSSTRPTGRLLPVSVAQCGGRPATASLEEMKTMLSDPNAEGLTGWPRIIRDAINMNTKKDGSMDAEMATGVVDLISQATFGALSQSELDLLKGGLMDPI